MIERVRPSSLEGAGKDRKRGLLKGGQEQARLSSHPLCTTEPGVIERGYEATG